jgi:hypothetical protein
VAIPIDQLPIGEGLHPDGTPGAEFFVDRRMLEALEESGPVAKYEDARFIEECVKQPDAIYEGLKRDNQEEGLCYSVRPDRDPDEPEATALPRSGYAFLVFVRRGAVGYIVFDWAWREEDGDHPGHPLRWENDFTRRTWTRN